MHEVEKGPVDPVVAELRRLNETLDEIKDINISTFVQLSRILDLAVVQGFSAGQVDAVQELLDDHERGVIHTAEPRLKKFGAGYEEED